MFERIAIHGWLCWALYLLAAGVTLTSESHRLCPQPCRCNTMLLEANCYDSQLNTVPDSLPQNTKLLNLTNNKIRTLVQQQFKALPQLLHLDLSDNELIFIEVESFIGLQNLINLRLARNHLKIIPVGALAGMPKLKSLDMSDNEILVFLDFTFCDLPALQFLSAADNDIVFISHQALSGLTSLEELHLDGCNLTAVPTEALTQLIRLRSFHFHQLGIETLPNYSFRNLANLKELVISHCPGLKMISGNSLFGLNLTSLAITHSNLSSVPYIPLQHLVYLVFLDFSFNPITYIQGNKLGDLLRLQELRLVGGSLLCIEVGAFKGLSYLRLLNVSMNFLSTLEMGAFQSVDTLRTLGLDNNPLACDCRLLWLARRRLILDFGGNSLTCSTSVHSQGLHFLDLEENELSGLLTCRQPRILNRKSQETRVEQGHTVVFYCNAEGDPVPSVTWLNPQLKPVSPTGRIWVLSNGSLEIRYAQPQDSGTYLCVASNAAGNTSLPVRLHVQALPKSSRNLSRLTGWFVHPGVNGNQKFPFDFKTLLVAAAIGFISFFSSVSVCFIFMLFWSKSRGQIKHTATIAYVPRSTTSGGKGGAGSHTETSRFTMKLI